MKQIFHARKKRQLRFLVKKLKRLLKNANENTQNQINYLVKQIRTRTKELSKLVATSYLKKVVGSVALVAGLTFSTQVTSQTFEAPVSNPFGLSATTYYNLPSFADMDNDGDLDIVMSHIGVSIDYYENVGDVNTPSFAAPVEGAFGIGIIDTDVMTPGDLDGDGDFDLIATTYGGGVSFRENTGDASSPQFAAPVADPFGISFTGDYVNFPALVDIDADGDLDLFIGASTDDSAFIRYFENTGSATNPQFAAPQDSPFGIATAEYYFMPSFVDMDDDGDLDILTSDFQLDPYVSIIKYFENTGSNTNPQFATPIENPFELTPPVDDLMWPAVADLDGDSDFDILSGLDYGAFIYFENTTALGASNKNLEGQVQLDISPNPVQNEITIQTDGEFEQIEIFNTTGKLMKTYAGTERLIQLGTWNSGIYMIRFIDEEGSFLTRKIQKE